MEIAQAPPELAAQLRAEFGPLLDSRSIMRLLGFRAHDTCIKALRNGSLGIPAFRLPGRPGYFVLTEEFASWLARHRQASATEIEHCQAGHKEKRLT